MAESPPKKRCKLTDGSKLSFAVIGDFFVDVQASIPELPKWDADVETKAIEVLPGGSAANTARQLHALAAADGGSALFFGTTGQDLLGTAALQHLEAQGFCTTHLRRLPGRPSSACIVLSGKQDRAFVSCYSSVKALTVEHIDQDALKKCQHVHVGGYLGVKGLHTSEFTALLKQCKDAGATLSLGTNSACDGLWLGEGDHLRSLLPMLDLLIMSESELEQMTKALGTQPTALSPELTVVETRGREGVRISLGDGQVLNVPALLVKEPVDPCGAGDSFAAGFLFSWASKSDPREAATWGNATASCNIRRFGACAEPVGLEEVRRAREELGATVLSKLN